MSTEITRICFSALIAASAIAIGCGDDDGGGPGTGGTGGSAGIGGSAGGEGGSGAKGGSAGKGGTQGSSAGAGGGGQSGSGTDPAGGAGAAGDAGSDAGAGGEPEPQGGRGGSADDGGAAGTGGGEPDLMAERWLAFRLERQTEPAYTYPLFAVPVPKSSDPLLVAPDVEKFEWSADGTRLLYVTPGYGTTPNAAYLVPITSSGIGEPEMIHLPLTGTDDRVLNATLSPDGQAIAIQLFEDGWSRWYIRLVASAPDAWNRVSDGVEGTVASEPGVRFSWSPAGQRIAIIEPTADGYDHLVGAGATGPLGDVYLFDASLLEWSSDGSHFLLESMNYEPDVYALRWVNSQVVWELSQLNEDFVQNDFTFATIAPDESAVAFKAESDGEFDLFVKTIGSSSSPAKLDGVAVQNAWWLADSEGLLYWGYGPGEDGTGPHLYVVPKDGGSFTRLNPEGTVQVCSSGQCLRRADDAFVFTTSDFDQTENQLLDVTFAGTTPSVRPLTELPAATLIDAFEVGPDASDVLMIVTKPSGKEVIWIDRSAEPPVARLVVALPAEASPFTYTDGPAFSSDSKYFHYAANDDLDPDGMVDVFVSEIVNGVPSTPVKLTGLGSGEQLYGVLWQP